MLLSLRDGLMMNHSMFQTLMQKNQRTGKNLINKCRLLTYLVDKPAYSLWQIELWIRSQSKSHCHEVVGMCKVWPNACCLGGCFQKNSNMSIAFCFLKIYRQKQNMKDPLERICYDVKP